MPKIRLIKYLGSHHDGQDFSSHSTLIFENALSDWEEVTEEERDLLVSGAGGILNRPDGRVVVIEDITSKETVTEFISDIKEFIKRKTEEARDRAEKYERAKKQREEKAQARKLAKARKLLGITD